MPPQTLDPIQNAPLIISQALEQGAAEAGIRLEYVGGVPVWEASPVYRHQKKVDAIRESIREKNGSDGEGCACISVADLSILFEDGSIKRPDISIFCSEPEEQDSVCTLVPNAVIEIISKGYEKKDMEISLPFYLKQKIADIVIFDPATNRVLHYREGELSERESPAELTFVCGCRLTV